MDQLQFKESGSVDIDGAKFKQDVFQSGPPRNSAARNICEGRSALVPLLHQTKAVLLIRDTVTLDIPPKALQFIGYNKVLNISVFQSIAQQQPIGP